MAGRSKKSIRVGYLGGGFIAAIHHECIQRVYGVDVEEVGVFDLNREHGEAFAKARGITQFTSLKALLAETDVVDVCTPPYAHAQGIIDSANAGKHVMCEKPLTGYAPDAEHAADFKGNLASKEPMLQSVLASLAQINEAVSRNGVKFTYFENFVYTPQVQKEAEIVRKSNSQILRMIGDESHRGNLATYSSWWKFAGGGSLISTGSHPLGAILYLKRVEGEASYGKPIRPVAVSARVHGLTGIPGYRDAGFIRCNYYDVEDYAWVHVVFEDGTVGDVVTGATVLGGIHDYVDVFANNHSTRCIINPVSLVDSYNPKGSQFQDININTQITTQEGWLHVAPDENWMFGYQAEMQDAMEAIAFDRQPISGLQLSLDTLNVIYSAYLSAERLGQEVVLQRL
ncbi:MAG: Gfo/Idh/MocA family oxidoreductase [Chloroflexi bacterium]|nr:Gfo/Idh/MocA family oxidoreductase [Chloroflexota bacterium]